MRVPWALFVALVIAGPAQGHDFYDKKCCDNQDCAPASKIIRNADGSITVTTKHGTARYYPRYRRDHRRPSKDQRYHACMRRLPSGRNQGPLAICLYVPGVS